MICLLNVLAPVSISALFFEFPGSRGDGLPSLAMRVQEDPNFGLARQIIGWRGHARTTENLPFPCTSIGDGLPPLSTHV